MANSMTGYGRASVTLEGLKLQVEIRSVNSRSTEVFLHLPVDLAPFEMNLRRQIQEGIGRGKVDCRISLEGHNSEQQELYLDEDLAKKYLETLEALGKQIERPCTLGIRDLLQFSDWISLRKIPLPQEQLQALLEEATEQALEQLQTSRSEEGVRLQEEIFKHFQNLRQHADRVQHYAPTVLQNHYQRLRQRTEELLGEAIDPQRLAQEMVLLADKTDVSEEIARLFSHLKLFQQTLEEGERPGKKLDFILQELLREVNTLGSKANDACLTEQVVEMKMCIEKMREQVQNIE